MAGEFYYNLATGEIEEGPQSDWSVRLGPYPTREAAARALDIAYERSEDWEEADRAWRKDWSAEPTEQAHDETDD